MNSYTVNFPFTLDCMNLVDLRWHQLTVVGGQTLG